MKAEDYKSFLQVMIPSQLEHLRRSGPYNDSYNDLKLLTFNVCDNVTELTAVITDLLLDSQKAISYRTRAIQESMVATVYTYLPPQMTSLVLDFFSFTNTYVHYFDMVRLPDGTSLFSRFVGHTRNLLAVVDHFGWQDIFLVLVSKEKVVEENGISPFDTYYNLSLKALKDAKKCIQVQTLRPAQVASIKGSLNESWLRGHSNTAVILFGRCHFMKDLYLKLQNLYNDIGLQILTQDYMDCTFSISERNHLCGTILSLEEYRRGSSEDVLLEDWIFDIPNKLVKKIVEISYPIRYELDAIAFYSFNLNRHFLFIVDRAQNNSVHDFQLKRLKFVMKREKYGKDIKDRVPLFVTLNYGICNRSHFKFFHTPLPEFLKGDSTQYARKTTCKEISCGPGRYKVYGEIAGGYGYRCDLCPVNHYKSTVGDDGCTPCRGQFSIDNGYRTKCIDPYKNIHPNILSMTLFQIILVFSSLGILTSIATICVFVRKRNTPVIKISDFKMSVLHLITGVFL